MIVGHWKNLDEVAKLTQSTLLAGVVQELWEQGQIIQKFPVTGLKGTSLKWNRQKTRPTADYVGIGEQLTWGGGMEYAPQVEFMLKTVIKQEALDEFVAKNYPTLNDYKARMMSELREGCQMTIEDKIIYGDPRNNQKESHGLHSLIDPAMAVDAGETALSLLALKRWIYKIKPKPDILLMAPAIADRFDQVAEYGLVTATGGANSVVRAGSLVTRSPGEVFGNTVTKFDGIPIWRTDFMGLETANTGPAQAIQTPRAKNFDAGTMYSILGVRFGQIDDGGVCMLLGADTGGPNFFDVVEFDHLEDYNAAGIRLIAYFEVANGSTKSIGGYYDFTDAEFIM